VQRNEMASRIEHLQVTQRNVAFGGTRFGEVGEYEMVSGIATVAIDPRAPANRAIADVALAAEADGWVRFQTEVVMLSPKDPARSSRVMIVDIPNRGNKLALARLNDGANQFQTAAQAGNGWAMRQGHTMLWIGWQGDVALSRNGQTVGTRFPVARQQGATVTGTSREEFIFDDTAQVSTGPLTYPAASLDPARARLTVRPRPDADPVVLPTSSWRYLSENQIEIQRPKDFDGGAIYHFQYEAKDPVVMGLGMAATRDVASFIRSGRADGQGQPGWLASAPPTTVVAMGISQSGRFLRDLIWQGFNTDVQGQKVFDAAMPIIAGSRKSYTNVRWAQPGRYSRQHEDHLYDGDQFPFGYAVTQDPVSGRRDGIFAQCLQNATCPKTMHVDSSLEFWQARASLIVSDGRGKAVALPDNVRAYLMGSTQHGPAAQPALGICQTFSNPAKQAATVRALMDGLVQWSRDGRTPPPSAYPSVADGTLAALDRQAIGFPDLSGLGIGFPDRMNALTVTDYGVVPPQENKAQAYLTLLPRTDADGIDVAAIRTPEVAVPVATYTGWALRAQGYAAGDLCSINGSMIPLAATAQERSRTADPRPALAERYASKSDYVRQARAVAEKLAGQRYLLVEDIDRSAADARVRIEKSALPD